MMTDIEIAQNAELLPIKEVAGTLGISEDDLEFYGKYKAKLSDEFQKKRHNSLSCYNSSSYSFYYIPREDVL